MAKSIEKVFVPQDVLDVSGIAQEDVPYYKKAPVWVNIHPGVKGFESESVATYVHQELVRNLWHQYLQNPSDKLSKSISWWLEH